MKVESLSADIQTLMKDSSDKSRPSAGRFYPSVYLFIKSATEKMLCNALLVLKEKLNPSRSGALFDSKVLATTVTKAPAVTVPPNIAGASKYNNYNGGMICTEHGDVIVENIKYKYSLDQFEYFEGIFIHFTFSFE